MKTKSRRIFLRNTSLATTGVLLISPLAAKKYSVSGLAIGCAPDSIKSLTGTIGSVKSGNWSDPSTWGGKVPDAGDTPLISGGHNVNFDMNSTTVAGVNVNSGGVLEFNASKSSELVTTENIVVQGKLVMKPSSPAVQQKIRFIGIDENNFVGGGMDVLGSDVGLWVMGSGQLDLSGSRKKSWTRTTSSVNKGAVSFNVQDANGWSIGDEIVLVPTDKPITDDGFDFNETTNLPVDKFAVKFEKRSIVAISGNSVTVNSPFLYDHNQVSTDTGKTWTPEVANLSRNVRIEGTVTGRTHIFIRSTLPQNIYYIAARYLGPRKKQGRSRPELITGRYGLHFHHCMYGSKGSMVEGCAIFDTGNRAYVPHMSHGITMTQNVAFNCLEAAYWWDFQETSHYITYESNLGALVTRNGIDSGCRGMEMNMGDGNIARNNVLVYCHSGDEHSLGAYSWNANSEGVWIFENNLSHSNRTGLFVWQNTGNNHTIVGYESYNDYLGIFHGAYINSYTYTNCLFHNSLARVKATSGNSSGVRFEKTVFDGANALPFVTEIYPSPVTSGADHNAFRECTFKNYKEVAVRVNTFAIGDENTRKNVSLVKCSFSGNMVDFTRESVFDSKVFIQPASGPASVVSQGGTSAIAAFAPFIYGNGTGLKGEYYSGSNFANHSFTRIDSMIMFQGWGVDRNYAPHGVHHLLQGDQFSVRWTGKLEAQYTEPYKFRVEGSGGFRVYLNNVQIINSWFDRADSKDSITSAAINLVAGEKYDFKIEHMNVDGARACQVYWECPSIGRSIHIPQSQLYSDGVVIPPPPPAPDQPAVANAGVDIEITLPVSKAMLDGSASTTGSAVKSYQWIKVSGPASANILSNSSISTEVKDLTEGTYVFKLQVTSSKGIMTNDEVAVKVNPPTKENTQPLVANAGSDITVQLPTSVALLDASASSPKDSIKSYTWTKVSGPNQGSIAASNAVSTNVKDLVEGTYVFKVDITDAAGKVSTDDVRITVKPKPPVANAGSDISVTLPINSVVLNGSASSAPLGIATYEWTKISGPANFKIVNKNAISPVIQNLESGIYVFQLKITDKNGTTAVDEVTVTVTKANSKPNEPKDEKPKDDSPNTLQLSIKAWPNPSSYRDPNYFEINSNSNLPIRVTIYDPYGKIVSSWGRVPANSSIKWSEGMKKGTHVVVAEQGNVRKTLQLIKF